MKSEIPFKQYYSDKLQQIETYLEKSIPSIPKQVSILEKSMEYSLLAGGKRVRPILLLTTIESKQMDSDFALPIACSVEYIHTYSLIHDDLPCMDDDEMRRGKPTNHIKFGEDIALLAGDALLTHCFNIISSVDSQNVPAKNIVKIIQLLSAKAGIFGMVSGQVADISDKSNCNPQEFLEFIHTKKTGALITASIQIGAILAGFDDNAYTSITDFGEEIGKCFQIQDDILDETGNKDILGKTPGSDQRNKTLTYPSVYGLDKSYQLANQSYKKAINYLDKTGLDVARLKQLADFILKRNH